MQLMHVEILFTEVHGHVERTNRDTHTEELKHGEQKSQLRVTKEEKPNT